MKPSFNFSERFPRALLSAFLSIAIGFAVMMLGCLLAPNLHYTSQAQGLQSFATAPLTLVTGTGRHKFTVEIAENDAQRSQGLMFRRALAPDQGMLFIYPSDRIISMWMKNTFIPLDMVFISNDGRVVSVHERAVPGSLKAISSGVRARAVLELVGGSISRLGIRSGDRVLNIRLGAGR
jgi:uncharacterized membrane protein (UPF0127 family)